MKTLIAAWIAALSLAAPAFGAPGDLDTGFNGSGKLVDPIVMGQNSSVADIATRADGTIVSVGSVGGSDFFIKSTLPSGAPDTSFDGDGLKTVNTGATFEEADAVLALSNGDIIVGGCTTENVNTKMRFMFMKIQRNGQAATWGNGGSGFRFIEFDATKDDCIRGLALDPTDGGIVGVGDFDGAGDQAWAFARIDAVGNPDAAFGTAAKFSVDMINMAESAQEAVVLADGSIVATGNANGAQNFAAFKITKTGSPVNTFGGNNNGKQFIDLGGTTEQSRAMTRATDGNLLIAGITNVVNPLQSAVVKIDPSTGQLVNAFGTNGRALTVNATNFAAQDLLVQPDGKIVVVGTGGAPGTMRLARFTAAGQLDPNFGTAGVATASLGGVDDRFDTIAQSPDGDYAIGGRLFDGATASTALLRVKGGEPPVAAQDTPAAEPQPQQQPGRDTTPPGVTLDLKGATLDKLAVTLALSEPGSVALEVTGPVVKSSAKKKKGKPLAVAKATVRFAAAGRKTVSLKLTSKAKKALKRKRSVRLKFAAAATDTSGNRATKTVSKTVRRAKKK